MKTHLALIGPTASGKSALALQLAKELGDIEIVSIDSMQIYRGMDIGTAKPTPEERNRVQHHLIDVVDPSESWSVAQFQEQARAAVREIESRNHRAVLVGGTGLYFHAVIDDLRFPSENLEIRHAIEAQIATPEGLAQAYAELSGADPQAAEKIEPNNGRRIARALEVIRSTGQPFSSFGSGVTTFGTPVFPVDIVGIWLPRPVLNERVDQRVQIMREAGLEEEVKQLDTRPWHRTAREAIGYKELVQYMHGNCTLDEAFATIAQRTRSFGKRQRMWFRRDPRITWVGAREDSGVLYPALQKRWVGAVK